MEPRRLLEDDDDRFDLRLLRSAQGDEAPSGAKGRAAVALGLSASSVVATSTAHGAKIASKLTLTALSKWLGAGIVSGIVVTGSVSYVTLPHAPRSVVVRAAPSVPTPAAPAPNTRTVEAKTTATDTPAPVPTMDVVAPRREARAPAVPSAEPVAAPSATPQNGSLAPELAILNDARRALVARDPAAVLRALDTYDAAPHTGVLDAEASMLRVEAWLQQGDRARAVELARRLLAGNPSSAHATRLRRIIDAAP